MLKPLLRGMLFPREVSSEWESVIKEAIGMLDVIKSAVDLQERSALQNGLAPNLALAELALFFDSDSLLLAIDGLADSEVCR